MQKKITKIVLTGGHAATTAVSVVEEIKRREKNIELFWIGPKKAIEGKSIETASSLVLPEAGVYHYSIVGGRLQLKWTRWTIPSLLKIPISFIQSLYLLIKIRPSAILSFGGYAALPVIISGWLMRIPIIIHEQTASVGLANKLSSKFANVIAISREESRPFFPKRKIILTGNPILSKILQIQPKERIGIPPVIFITGGSTGAQSINRVVDKILDVVLSDFQVIHQAGKLDYDYFLERKRKLPSNLESRYEVFSYASPLKFYKNFEAADILISRAGANTISEIMVTARPSILIPIPWSRNDEQMKNAELASKCGIGLIIKETELNPEILLEKIFFIRDNWGKIVRGSDKKIAKLDSQASKKIVDVLEGFIQ